MKAKILVVESELTIGLDLVVEIENLGHEVVGLTDRAQDAVEIAYLLQPDLALIKIGIPGSLEGVHTAQLLRRAYQIPAIFVATNLDPSTFARAEQAFPISYLTNPHNREGLKVSIESALRHKQKRKAAQRISRAPEMLVETREAMRA